MDTVSSQWLVRGNDGREYKPDDYLTAFTTFVKEHQTDIHAIGILIARPAEWSPTALRCAQSYQHLLVRIAWSWSSSRASSSTDPVAARQGNRICGPDPGCAPRTLRR